MIQIIDKDIENPALEPDLRATERATVKPAHCYITSSKQEISHVQSLPGYGKTPESGNKVSHHLRKHRLVD